MRTPSIQNGFTLIEILVVLGMIAILATVVLIAINPSRQFAQARNSQRISNVNAILNAMGQNLADNRGLFTCAAGTLPTTAKKIATGAGNYDAGPCLVPTYLSALPFDPSGAGAHYTSTTDYDTGYFVATATSTGRITISAPSAELGQSISITR